MNICIIGVGKRLKLTFIFMWWQTPLLKFSTKCWIFHPRYLDVVVAKGIASVNKNSLSLATIRLRALCREFNQMVMVTKVHQHGTPCLNLELKHLPWANTLDVACVGTTCEKAYILWACNYLVKKWNGYSTLSTILIYNQEWLLFHVVRHIETIMDCGTFCLGI